ATHGLTIPAGCGPSVGIAGLTLGGGLGILGRKHGLTCDHLLGARVVLADGRVVDCDEHHDEELFWALRGAGGGHFGVVTSLVFRTPPAPARAPRSSGAPGRRPPPRRWCRPGRPGHPRDPTSWTPPCG